MIENPRKVIQNQQMFSKNDPLLVAVSGGLDSMVLCDVLYQLNFKFAIAHCNYQLRIPDADEDQEMIKTWAQNHQIDYFFKTCPLDKATNIQDQARVARYKFFESVLEEQNFKFLLTAHHADDQVENLFLQLSRGSGLKGIKGMLSKSGLHIRPFLTLAKSDLKMYAHEHKIIFREDVSNKSNYYLRNFFRNDVIPLIESKVPAFSQMAIRSIDHLQELYPLIQDLYETWKRENINLSDSEIWIQKNKINGYFLSWFLAELEFHPITIQQIKSKLNNSGNLFYSRSHYQLAIEPDGIKLRLQDNSQSYEDHFIYTNSGSLKLHHGHLEWDFHNADIEINYTNPNVCYFDRKQLNYPMQLRNWHAGDRIQSFGMNGKHKKIQDVFTDKKLGLFEKEKMYLLISEEQVLWVCGLQRSDLARIDKNTNSIIKFTFTKRTN
ncbi:MAG TPA: tRNA lysidine(34) synthetase TilS [Saprospiraceae bacterium]|nr:tRNA lysidine(34) synthetase TilS [Saprospiraceae bacterium]